LKSRDEFFLVLTDCVKVRAQRLEDFCFALCFLSIALQIHSAHCTALTLLVRCAKIRDSVLTRQQFQLCRHLTRQTQATTRYCAYLVHCRTKAREISENLHQILASRLLLDLHCVTKHHTESFNLLRWHVACSECTSKQRFHFSFFARFFLILCVLGEQMHLHVIERLEWCHAEMAEE
jgi:hypothetical protein